MSSTNYAVNGIACATCMAHVMDNVRAVPVVAEVAKKLASGAVSRLTVSSPARVETDQVRDAIGGSGFSGPRWVRQRRRRIYIDWKMT